MDIENNSMIEPSSFKGTVDDRGTYDDLESILKGIQFDTSQPQNEVSYEVLQKEQQELYKERKQVEENDLIDFNDRIFQRLLTEDELKTQSQQQNQCFKCTKKFTLINKKHQCKFCGNLSCDLHAKKHREDPEKKADSFKRICDNCEDKFLKRMINYEFQRKKDKQDKFIQQLEQKQEQIIQVRKKKQMQLDELKQKEQESSNQFANDTMKLGMKINRIQQEIKSLTEDYNKAKENLDLVDDKIIDFFNKINNTKTNTKEKENSEQELRHKIAATEQDIKESQYIIDEIEKKITENNLRIEKMKVSKKNFIKQNSNQDLEQNIQAQQVAYENPSNISFKKHNTDESLQRDSGSACGVQQCNIY